MGKHEGLFHQQIFGKVNVSKVKALYLSCDF